MNAGAVGLGLVTIVVVATLLFGLYGVRGIKMDPHEFMVGGRRFGALLLWLLLAGEIYTTFTFLGASGWAYGKGGPAYYILCYGTIAYIISYFIGPPIHRMARERHMLTGPDFFTDRYGSRFLGALVALLGFAMLVPYATVQLTGVQILLTVAGYGTINPIVAVGIAFGLMALFTFATGLRGAAFASIIKDIMVLLGVLFAGVVLPMRFFGSPVGAMNAVLHTHPGWLTIARDHSSSGLLWVITTVLLTGFTFFLWPHQMATIYSARDENTLRRNAIFLPFYQVMLLLVFFAGFTALALIPGIKNPDSSFLVVLQRYYPPWVLGLVCAAGCLAGLVPAAVQVLAAASIVSKNVFIDNGLVRDPRSQTMLTRVLVLALAILAFAMWAFANETLVGLLLIGYNGIAQLIPGVYLGLTERRPPAFAVGAGIVAGIALLVYFAATKTNAVGGVNTGLIAVALNAAVLGIVTAIARLAPAGRAPYTVRG
jgi:SSS family solute:Na+ symporter